MLKQYNKLFEVYLYLTIVAIIFFIFGDLYYRVGYLFYLLWNLLLAWIPLIISLYLRIILTKKLFSSWQAIIVGLIWLIFIPNSFYLLSDYIHLQEVGKSTILYDVLLFSIIIFTGVLIGFSSVSMVFAEFKKRFSKTSCYFILSLIFLIISFGIYIGRDLRWNSWDVVINPAGLLLDVFYQLKNFSNYPSMLIIVFSYFLIMISLFLGLSKIIKLSGKIYKA